MKEITLNLPVDLEEQELKLPLALALYEKGKLSLGQAAQWCGFSISTFVELLSKEGIPVVQYPTDELERDVHNA